MLLYSNYTFWRIVFATQGSLIYRYQNLLSGGLVAVFTLALVMLQNQESWLVDLISPSENLGWRMIGDMVVVIVVFHSRLAWQRYWEALTQLQSMYSKWTDAMTQTRAFFDVTLRALGEQTTKDAAAKAELLRGLQKRVRDRFSLLSALAAHRLSHGDVQRMDKRASMAKWKDQVVTRLEIRVGTDLTGATQLPRFCATEDLDLINDDRHMRDDWFGEFPVTGEVSPDELRLLESCSDRVNAVMFWLLHDLCIASSHFIAAPPVQTRVYQELSDGCLFYNNAVKIADVPFPLIFMQGYNLLGCLFTVFIPIYCAVFTSSHLLSPLLAFVVHQSFCVMNHVSCELENPFGCGANNISIRDYHARFLRASLELDGSAFFKDSEPLDEEFPDVRTVDSFIVAARAAKAKNAFLALRRPAAAKKVSPAKNVWPVAPDPTSPIAVAQEILCEEDDRKFVAAYPGNAEEKAARRRVPSFFCSSGQEAQLMGFGQRAAARASARGRPLVDSREQNWVEPDLAGISEVSAPFFNVGVPGSIPDVDLS